mgnify:CR=1 FL=1
MSLVPITFSGSGSPPFPDRMARQTSPGGFLAALFAVLERGPEPGVRLASVLPDYRGGAGTPEGRLTLFKPDGCSAAGEPGRVAAPGGKPAPVVSPPPAAGNGYAAPVRAAVSQVGVETGHARPDVGFGSGGRPDAALAGTQSDRSGFQAQPAAERPALIRHETPVRIEAGIVWTKSDGGNAGIVRPGPVPLESGRGQAVRLTPVPEKAESGAPVVFPKVKNPAGNTWHVPVVEGRVPAFAVSDRQTVGQVAQAVEPGVTSGNERSVSQPAVTAAVDRVLLSTVADRPAPGQVPNPAVSADAAATLRNGTQPELPAVARQLAEAVLVQVRRLQAGVGQAVLVRITLEPPQLGRVTLKLTFGRDGLEAQFLTPDRAVKSVLEQALPQLREALLRQEINLGNTTVFLGQEDPGERAFRLLRNTWAERHAPDEVSEPPDGEGRTPTPQSGVNYLV